MRVPHLGDVGFVRDQHDGDASLLVQALKQAHDLDAGACIEITGGLVGEQDRRIVNQRARDGDALLLAARSWFGKWVRRSPSPTAASISAGKLVALGGLLRRAAVEHRQRRCRARSSATAG
jgi:hypothetical protein